MLPAAQMGLARRPEHFGAVLVGVEGGEGLQQHLPHGDRNATAPHGLDFTVRTLLFHPPHFFPPSFSSIHESTAGGQDQADGTQLEGPNDPPVPWCSVLSMGAHLLVSWHSAGCQ